MPLPRERDFHFDYSEVNDDFELVFAKVRFQIKDIVDYYGKTKHEKSKLRQVCNSILQRCRLGYKALEAERRRKSRDISGGSGK